MQLRQLSLLAVVAPLMMLVTTQPVSASVIPIGAGAFGPGSTLTTFAGLSGGTEVNNLIVNGILFQYSLGNGIVIIDTGGGPGTTNNIDPPNILSVGNPTGILTLVLPSLVDSFGYGFAVAIPNSVVPSATTISLFNDVTPVGTLSYAGAPDPFFAGGFAGISSTDPFNRVQLTFNAAVVPAWAIDNIRTQSQTPVIPEPTTMLLFGSGLAALARVRRRR